MSELSLIFAEPVDVAVLGAGVIGVSTAYWLARAGLSVVVIERESDAGMGTSFANGGQISVCHAEPWATPRAPLQVLRWLADPAAPLLFRPRLERQQWRWLASWLLECLPGRAPVNTEMIVKLALHSRACLQQLRQAHDLQYSHRTDGILHFYRTQAAFDAAKPVSELMQRLGCEREVVSAERVLAIEPALRPIANDIVGGTFTAEDESGDARLYCQDMRAICESMGVQFVMDADIQPPVVRHGKAEICVQQRGEHYRLKASQIAVCMGVWSAEFLRSLGQSINVYPAKGYSVTLPIQHIEAAPTTSLTDDEHKLVMSRLGDKLRVAGTAELSGYSRELNHTRCEAILDRVKTYFPDMGGFEQAEYWAGLRPSTPSNVPIIGKSTVDNVWINTGHGSLGWTMACGSGELLARQIVESLGAKPAESPRT